MKKRPPGNGVAEPGRKGCVRSKRKNPWGRWLTRWRLMPRTGTVLVSVRHLWVCLSLSCWMEFASKLFPSQTNSAIMVWLVGFCCGVEMGSFWLGIPSWNSLCSPGYSFVLFLLFSVFREEAINSSINLVYVLKKILQRRGHRLFGSFPRVVLQMLMYKTSLIRNLMFR